MTFIAKILWIFTAMLMWFSNIGHASTFIGNGGTTMDAELRHTVNQIYKIAKSISTMDESELDYLCYCDEKSYSQTACQSLESLTESQESMCRDLLTENADTLVKLTAPNNPHIKLIWQSGPISAKEHPKGPGRKVQAVAQRDKKIIRVSLSEFKKLSTYERIQILGHEFFHLIPLKLSNKILRENPRLRKNLIQGKFLRDSGTFGPYTGDWGQAHLLDVLGTSLAHAKLDISHNQMTDYERISKPSASLWFDLSSGSAIQSKRDQKEIGTDETFSVSTFQLTYMRRTLGVFSQLQSTSGYGSWNDTSATMTFRSNRYGLGVKYRILPFGSSLSMFGFSFFETAVGINHGKHKIDISDKYTSLSDEVSSFSYFAHTSYYFPLFFGLWAKTELAFEHMPYKFEKLDIKQQDNQYHVRFGVSYGI